MILLRVFFYYNYEIKYIIILILIIIITNKMMIFKMIMFNILGNNRWATMMYICEEKEM